jgi:hypothetical protein
MRNVHRASGLGVVFGMIKAMSHSKWIGCEAVDLIHLAQDNGLVMVSCEW